jgi:hypothetical protein
MPEARRGSLPALRRRLRALRRRVPPDGRKRRLVNDGGIPRRDATLDLEKLRCDGNRCRRLGLTSRQHCFTVVHNRSPRSGLSPRVHAGVTPAPRTPGSTPPADRPSVHLTIHRRPAEAASIRGPAMAPLQVSEKLGHVDNSLRELQSSSPSSPQVTRSDSTGNSTRSGTPSSIAAPAPACSHGRSSQKSSQQA